MPSPIGEVLQRLQMMVEQLPPLGGGCTLADDKQAGAQRRRVAPITRKLQRTAIRNFRETHAKEGDSTAIDLPELWTSFAGPFLPTSNGPVSLTTSRPTIPPQRHV
jgi:hypothetical protein